MRDINFRVPWYFITAFLFALLKKIGTFIHNILIMARKLLIFVLALALLFELFLTGVGFFAKEAVLDHLGVVFNLDNDFFGYLISWFCLFVSLITAYAIWRVVKNREDYMSLCYLLGFWWVGIGIGIYLVFKKPEHLYTDSLKGLLVMLLTWRSARGRKTSVSPANSN